MPRSAVCCLVIRNQCGAVCIRASTLKQKHLSSNRGHVCNVWDAHMGSVILMTATAVPFYYNVVAPVLQILCKLSML